MGDGVLIVCWAIDWAVGWLVRQLVGRLVSWLVSWLVGWLFDWLVGRLVDRGVRVNVKGGEVVQILCVSSDAKFRVEQQKPHHHPCKPTCDQVAKTYNLSAVKLQHFLY